LFKALQSYDNANTRVARHLKITVKFMELWNLLTCLSIRGIFHNGVAFLITVKNRGGQRSTPHTSLPPCWDRRRKLGLHWHTVARIRPSL